MSPLKTTYLLDILGIGGYFSGIVNDLRNAVAKGFAEIIKANLQEMLTTINEQAEGAAKIIGTSPFNWNAGVFDFIRNFNTTVIVPVAGIILTAVMCIELIQMVTERNNMNDGDTFALFKFIVKMWVGVWLVAHSFDFTVAIFDVSQHLVNQATSFIGQNTFNQGALENIANTISEETPVVTLGLTALMTTIYKYIFLALGIIISVFAYGRVVEVFMRSSVAAIPFATLCNKEWGQIGTNYIKGLFAVGLEGLFMIIAIGIFSAMIRNIDYSSLGKSLVQISIFGFLLVKVLARCSSISKSVVNAN